jgi:predicted dehydrogenase
MKELLDSKFFGEILGFWIEQGTIGGWVPVSGYHLHRSQAGGGELISTGTHFIDRLLYWFGEPADYAYEDDSFGGPEANCKFTLRYDGPSGRFSGTVFLSKTIRLRNKFVMDTEKYICERTEAQTRSVTVYPKDRPHLRMELLPNARSADPEPDYFQEQLEKFVGAIRGRCTVPVDGRFGSRSVDLIERLYHRRTQLPEPWLLYRNRNAVRMRVEA